MKIKFLLLALVFCASFSLKAQNVAINTTGNVANSSAMLDVESTTKGMLIPRMTAAQKDLIATPATGLLIYQTDGTSGFYFNQGTPAAKSWILLGGVANNSITTDKIADNAVTVAKLPSGATNSTFLRGDGTWAAPTGSGGGGSTGYNFLTKNSDYTITTADMSTNLIVVTTSSSVVQITLPSASAVGAGKTIHISGAVPASALWHAANVKTGAGDTMLGSGVAPNSTNFNEATSGYDAVTISLVSDGINKWFITSAVY